MRTNVRGLSGVTRVTAFAKSPGMLLTVLVAAAALDGCGNYSATTSVQASFGPVPEFDAGAVSGRDPILQPTFASTVEAATPPPALSGGTLLVTKSGSLAVASDPDRDAIYVVDLGSASLAQTVTLSSGDEPGRLVEDGAGLVHVALRGGGALVTIDPATGNVLYRRTACPAPRGVAWDSTTDSVWVACATGELVALPASGGGSASSSFVVERDLRDVVVSNGSLSVSSFRSAEVLRLASTGGTVTRRDQLPSPTKGFSPHVAWRVVGGPSGAIVAVHQAATLASLSTQMPGGYSGGGCGGGTSSGGGSGSSSGTFLQPSPPQDGEGGAGEEVAVDGGVVPEDDAASGNAEDAMPGPAVPDAALAEAGSTSCFAGAMGVISSVSEPVPGGGLPFPVGCGIETGAVMSVLTVMAANGTVTVNTPFQGVLPVDVAVSSDGSLVGAVAPGNAFTPVLPTYFLFSSCGTSIGVTRAQEVQQPIAVAFDASNDLLIQNREPAALWIVPTSGPSTPRSISLSSVSREDSGYDIFHSQAGGMIACASCHPEGRDDGNVWTLDDNLRRTPSLRGTIAGTAPYHWPGDEPSLNVLVNDVYTVRMSGASLDGDQMGAVTNWVTSLPAPPAPTWIDAASAQRGKALFNSDGGCATCHSGAKFTNNQTMNVGTGGSFQVPPLVGVGWRTPLLHNGCAATIADRFGQCGTSQHGSADSLPPSDLSDLEMYLESL